MQVRILCDTGNASFTARRTCRQLDAFLCQATKEAEKLDEDLAASDELLPNGVKRLHVTVPAEKVAKAWQKAIKLEGKSHDFPGFRQGKKVSIEATSVTFRRRASEARISNHYCAALVSVHSLVAL